MKILQKALVLSTITTGLLLGSTAAFADNEKVWTDHGPIIKVHPTTKDFKIKANISFDKETNINGFYSHHTFNGTVGVHGINHILHRLHLHEGGKLVIKEFEITDEEGNALDNCNLIDNPAFIAGGESFNITVDDEGCHIN